jgi:localization factor PodJL
MTAGAPWSVKGIDPKAREVAKELAARAGMTLGEWLNRSILDGETPPATARRPQAARELPQSGTRDPFDRPEADLRRLTEVLDRLADRLEGSEGRTGKAISNLETTVRATLGRLEQAVEHSQPPGRQESRFDRHEGVLRALENALSRLAAQVQDGEVRTREALDGLRSRLDRAESRPQASAAGMDQISLRVGEIQDRTAAAMSTLREAFAGVDERLARLESAALEGVEERLREVSFRLGERLDAARAEMSRELGEASGRRISELERALADLTVKVEKVEKEASGRVALDPGPDKSLDEPSAARRPADEVERIGEILKSRLSRADPGQAATLSRLGDEVTRMGDSPGAWTEPPASPSQGGWDVATEDDISRRIRQSEDRTARLLEEARLRLDSRFPPSRMPAAATRFDEDEHARVLALFDDEDQGPATAGGVDRSSDTGEFPVNAEAPGDWPVDLLAEARAANARSPLDILDGPGPTDADQDAPTLPGLDLAAPRPAPRPRRFAGPGLTSLAVFSISASLVGFATLTLFDAPSREAGAGSVARTQPDVLAPAPQAPVRAAVALAPAASVPAPASADAGRTPAAAASPTARALSADSRFRRAQADLAAGRITATTEIQALAASGHRPAMRSLSGLYSKGEGGLSKDPLQARSWMRRAAEAGDRVAMHSYGLDLMNGTNGAQDPAMGVGWIRRAAEAGLVDSQFNMGAIYERGMGVPKDLRQAFVWYSRAADGGDGEALRQVERLRPVLSASASTAAEDIRLAQRALGRLGYYSGPADGALSAPLRSAIEAYQKDQNTPPTGLLDEATLRRLAMLGR